MRRTDCPNCGRPVIVAELRPEPAQSGEHQGPSLVVLDRHEGASGAGRYAIWDDGTARPVAARAEVLAYPLHRCGEGVRR